MRRFLRPKKSMRRSGPFSSPGSIPARQKRPDGRVDPGKATGRLLARASLEGVDHPLLVGKRAGLELRVTQLAVAGPPEAPAAGWNQFEGLDPLLEVSQ